MIFLPLLLSLILGVFLLSTVCQDKLKLNSVLFYPLALGLGLCASALCTYFTFLVFGKFRPPMIIGCHTILTLGLAFSGYKYFPWKDQCSVLGKNWKFLFLVLPFGILIYTSMLIADYQPYGAWDAWAVYNLKFRFLVLGGDRWTAIFNDLHWYTQPNYPLMLPFVHTWLYTFTQEGINFIPKLTGILFYFITTFTVIGALAQYIHRGIAIIAGLILFIIPFYAFVATAQYADVLLSFTLLASVVSVFFYIHQPSTQTGILAGLTLGWMSFVKNEGVVCMLLLILLSVLYLIISRRGSIKKRTTTLIPFGISIFLAALPSLFFKLFLAPKNKDIFNELSLAQMKFFNREGLQTVLQFSGKELLQQHWSFCWIFMGLLTMLSLKSLCRKEHLFLLLFFVGYAVILIMVYLTTGDFDLNWRLENTLPRILFYLLPSVLFSVSLWSFRHEKISA